MGLTKADHYKLYHRGRNQNKNPSNLCPNLDTTRTRVVAGVVVVVVVVATTLICAVAACAVHLTEF